MKLWLLASICLAIIKPSQHDKSESRLPRNVYPEHYQIRINTSLEEFEHNSDVKIIIRCLKATNNITLHSRNLLLSNVELTTIDNKREIKIKPTFEEKYDFLHLNAEEELEVNKKYNLRIHFKGEIKTDTSGYFCSSYNKNGKKKWLTLTYFKPRHARAAFPCFDEPDLKAVFRIVLTQHWFLAALSNMPLKKQKCYSIHDSPKIWCENIYEDTPLMSTYSVAYVITSGFSSRTMTKMNQDITIWGQGKIIQQMRENIRKDFFEKYIAKASPFPKTDFVIVPNYPSPTGALENFGLVIVSEKFLRNYTRNGDPSWGDKWRRIWKSLLYKLKGWGDEWRGKWPSEFDEDDRWSGDPSWDDQWRSIRQTLLYKLKSWGDEWRGKWPSEFDEEEDETDEDWDEYDEEEDETDEDEDEDDWRRRRKDSDKRKGKGVGRRQKEPGGRSPAAKRAKKQGGGHNLADLQNHPSY